MLEQAKGQLWVEAIWHQKCAVVKSRWHSDTPCNIPGDQRIKPGRLARHVPSIAIGSQEPQASEQLLLGCPSLVSTGVLPHWLPFFTVPLANLHLNWPCAGGWCLLLLLHVKESQEPQRKCKYPLMALIQMDALMTIGPVPEVWGFFCQGETHRGHHNNTAKLCMQDKHYWHVKEHSQLLW